ncbi:MAG: YbhB/YbcL family Raf kinase inhibitor-like protein [Methylibium sp.]|nr:YbhB/YbcL family Raf kinase inhibitor-like protein [Methylibium sp.]
MLEKLPDVVGHALREQRAGIEKTVYRQLDLRAGTAAITLTSLAFADHAPIPALYTADGAGHSPPLAWSGVPVAARSLLLIVEDADAPTPQPLVHAIAVEISPHETGLSEGALKSPDHEGEGVKTGRNSYLGKSWLPPDPPPGHGVHRYVFQIFALAEGEPFSGTPGRDAVVEALRDRALASGCLIGTYERPDTAIKVGKGMTRDAAVGIENMT